VADYTQLQQDVADWFARDDLPVASFVSMAESELNRLLELQAMERMVEAEPTSKTAANLYYLDLPEDFIELLHMETNGYAFEYVTNTQLTTIADAGSDQPYVYSIAGKQLLFPKAWPVFYYYRARIPALSVTNLTNWYTDNLYDGLLHLCLDHGTTYIGQDNPVYRQKAINYMRDAQDRDDQARISGAPLVQRG